MKLRRSDTIFSKYIRERDHWTCKRCYTRYNPPTKALHCSHFFGRSKESTRFDELNCDSLCYGCHRYWEKEDREGYRDFKINQLGQKEFERLTIRANTVYKKRDDKLDAMIAKKMLDDLLASRGKKTVSSW